MRHAGVIALVAAAYFAGGKLGLSLAYVNESTTAVWPPAGIAVGSLLLFGPGLWPAVTIGAFAVNISTSGSLAASLAITAGNTLEALAAAWLVGRFANGRAAFDRTPDIIRFGTLAALGATTIAATIGTGALVAAGLAARIDAGSIWLTWWLGDAVGIAIVAPAIVLWNAARGGWNAVRAAEAVALAACLIATAAVVFGNTPVGASRLPLQFLAIPLLLWSAFRFGARETALAAATLSGFAIAGTLGGFGPFVRDTPNESLLLLQGFLAVITLVMLAVAAEVSGRLRAGAELRALNEALEARVDARTEELTRVHHRLLEAQRVAHIGSWEWDVANDSVWWSDELYRIFGLEPGRPLAYDDFLAGVHPEDRPLVEAEVRRAAADGRPFAFDHRVVRADGTIRVLHGQGHVVVGPDGGAVRMLGTALDVTERVAVEEQRSRLKLAEAARLDAEMASQAKDQFLAMLSHELRTPLNVALGWTHLLRSTTLDRHAARAIETIDRNLRLLSRLVADIVDVSRMAAGALALKIDNIDLAGVVRDAVDGIRSTAAIRGIAVDVDVDPSTPPIQGDAGRLQQVIGNLLSNAVKFAPSRGHVRLSTRVGPDVVEIVVEDDGPGIPAEFLPYVFEQFRQGDSSTTREHGGLGLGLSIAKHLVELHGGSIGAGNQPTGGAIFTVRLPVNQTMAMTN